MATFWVYGDESGIHDGADWCLVCGYAGADIAWEEFDGRWRRVLGEAGITDDDFHAKVFFGRDEEGRRLKPYTDWTDAEAKQFLLDLAATINGYALFPLGMAVNVADFFSFSLGERRYLTGATVVGRKFKGNMGAPTQPYYVAFQEVITIAVSRLPDDGSVAHFLFDTQNALSEHAVRAFAYIKKILPAEITRRMGVVLYGERKKNPALQAADLLTHLWYAFAQSGDAMTRDRHIALTAFTNREQDPESFARRPRRH